MASVSIKRDRDSLEWGREDEPLAKRINNLHLDPGAGTSSATISSGSGLQQQYQCLPPSCVINGVMTQLPPQMQAHHNHYHQGSRVNIPQTQLQIRGSQEHDNFQQQRVQHQQHQASTSHHQQQIINQQHELIHQQQQHHHQQQQLQQNDVQRAQSRLEEMVASRELPDSLTLQYPASNPTHNPHYFNVNKVLHHLHIDRLRRSGMID